MKKTQLVPYLGTEQSISSSVSSILQSTVHVPAHASIKKLKSERGIQDIFVPFFSQTESRGNCDFIRGCTSLLYVWKLPYVWVNPLLNWSACSLCWVEVGSCQAPIQPLFAFLSSPTREDMMKKLKGQHKNKEITKPMYLLARFSSDILCQKTDISVTSTREQMAKNCCRVQPQWFPKYWDCGKLCVNLLCQWKQYPVV